ncbi:hypothetical protein D3C79_799670 [compost metagenome]
MFCRPWLSTRMRFCSRRMMLVILAATSWEESDRWVSRCLSSSASRASSISISSMASTGSSERMMSLRMRSLR